MKFITICASDLPDILRLIDSLQKEGWKAMQSEPQRQGLMYFIHMEKAKEL